MDFDAQQLKTPAVTQGSAFFGVQTMTDNILGLKNRQNGLPLAHSSVRERNQDE